jgi:hypothetical protein
VYPHSFGLLEPKTSPCDTTASSNRSQGCQRVLHSPAAPMMLVAFWHHSMIFSDILKRELLGVRRIEKRGIDVESDLANPLRDSRGEFR